MYSEATEQVKVIESEFLVYILKESNLAFYPFACIYMCG